MYSVTDPSEDEGRGAQLVDAKGEGHQQEGVEGQHAKRAEARRQPEPLGPLQLAARQKGETSRGFKEGIASIVVTSEIIQKYSAGRQYTHKEWVVVFREVVGLWHHEALVVGVHGARTETVPRQRLFSWCVPKSSVMSSVIFVVFAWGSNLTSTRTPSYSRSTHKCCG